MLMFAYYMNYQLLVVAVLLLIIDSIYLKSTSAYFNKQVARVQGSPIALDMYAAILCYAVLAFGLYYFIIKEKRSVVDAFLLGFVIYMVFEATNKAIFKNWSWTSVLIDGVWGGILYALTTMLTYRIYNYLKKPHM